MSVQTYKHVFTHECTDMDMIHKKTSLSTLSLSPHLTQHTHTHTCSRTYEHIHTLLRVHTHTYTHTDTRVRARSRAYTDSYRLTSQRRTSEQLAFSPSTSSSSASFRPCMECLRRQERRIASCHS